MSGFVYILQNQKGAVYIGASTNPELRCQQHNAGITKSTKSKGPWELLFKQKYSDIQTAKKVEYKLKKSKSRTLINRILSEGVIQLQP